MSIASPTSLKSLVLFPLAGALVLLSGCDRQSDKQAQPQASQQASDQNPSPASKLDRSHKGTPMPAANLVDNTGESIDLASFKGKPLLVNLWATWCAPCIAEMPTLNALMGEQDKLKMTILPVSEDQGDAGKVVEILRKRKLDRVEPWMDEKGDLGFAYGGNLPVTILFDSEGKEVWRYLGGNDWTSKEARKLLKEAK